jgi:hypothetical protein
MLGVVSGRRRQGKPFLDALCKANGCFFFEAAEQRTPGRGAYTGAVLPPCPEDWREVLDAVLALGENSPVTVVIDEFPYLVRACPLPCVPRNSGVLEACAR